MTDKAKLSELPHTTPSMQQSNEFPVAEPFPALPELWLGVEQSLFVTNLNAWNHSLTIEDFYNNAFRDIDSNAEVVRKAAQHFQESQDEFVENVEQIVNALVVVRATVIRVCWSAVKSITSAAVLFEVGCALVNSEKFTLVVQHEGIDIAQVVEELLPRLEGAVRVDALNVCVGRADSPILEEGLHALIQEDAGMLWAAAVSPNFTVDMFLRYSDAELRDRFGNSAYRVASSPYLSTEMFDAVWAQTELLPVAERASERRELILRAFSGGLETPAVTPETLIHMKHFFSRDETTDYRVLVIMQKLLGRTPVRDLQVAYGAILGIPEEETDIAVRLLEHLYEQFVA